MDKSISVIIPAYQAESTIAKAINSIQFPNTSTEIIVVDDGSTDKTAEIINDLKDGDRRIKLISQPNLGRSSARNAGIKSALGEWIMFLDSDDYFISDNLQEIPKYLNEANKLIVFSMLRTDYQPRLGYSDFTVKDQDHLPKYLTLKGSDLLDWMLYGYSNNQEFLNMHEPNSACARIYRADIVRGDSGNKSVIFPENLSFSEDRLFNIQYLKAIETEDVTIAASPIYAWSIENSSTTAFMSAKDCLDLKTYINVLKNLQSENWISNQEINVLAQHEILSRISRIVQDSENIHDVESFLNTIFEELNFSDLTIPHLKYKTPRQRLNRIRMRLLKRQMFKTYSRIESLIKVLNNYRTSS